MNEFIKFRDKFIKNFNSISENQKSAFEVNLNKDEMWELYLNSFPEGTNEIFRERREHDCSCCKHFINSIGNVVFIENNQIKTIWDFDSESTTYQPVIDALDEYIRKHTITDIYVSKFKRIGTIQNKELTDKKLITFDHYYLNLPDKFIDNSSLSIPEIKGDYRETKNVFKRGLEELSQDSFEMVLELIAQNSLYKGNEWKVQLEKFLECKKEYESLSEIERNNYIWLKSTELGKVVARIRNTSIGTLLIDLSEGMSLDAAVRKYEKVVAPENYKRSKPIFTKKMLEDARNTISELGYLDSLERRFATLDDITVNNILFANKNTISRINKQDIFGELEKDISINPKKFSKVQEININDFINNVLPITKEIEILFENKHASNLVSLIAPKNIEAKSMFKWNNPFSWAYSGNITDSSMKENVKAAGGKVDGILRFSIQWNEKEDWNQDDYDAHCIEPGGKHIYFGDRVNFATGGNLDVDIMHPSRNKPAVENITWSSKERMQKGTYKFFVNNYCFRGGKSGFRAEIEFDGEIYSFEYNKALRDGENIQVAEVMFDGENFKIKELLPLNVSSREIWNLNTNQFIPVNVICYSPNYWDAQKGVGNQHVFFMLKDCINPEEPNGFYNEYLNQELNKHRKVMEALGSKLSVVSADDQLSGLGFSLTRRNELIVKVKGSTERMLKIKF